MSRSFLLFVITMFGLLAMSSCKTGCGCHGDPFGCDNTQDKTEAQG